MTDSSTSKPMLPRGAIPTPKHIIEAATPYKPDGEKAIPQSFLVWPTQMADWGNLSYADCVAAEEAFAKATASPQTFIPDGTLIQWALDNNVFYNGASIYQVLNLMQNKGIVSDGKTLKNGMPSWVNFNDANTLKCAIYNLGPVKIGLASSHLFSADYGDVTPENSGWVVYGCPPNPNIDHCVSLCGYGSFRDLASSPNAKWQFPPTPRPHMSPDTACYAMFTWDSIGIIDAQSLVNITYEAWARNPVTIVS